MLQRGAPLYAVMQLYDISSNWFAWIGLVLVLQIAFAEILQPRAFLACFRTIGSPIQRQYDERGNDGVVQWLYRIFILGTVSYTLLTVVNSYQQYELLPTIQQYGATIGMTLLVGIIKNQIDRFFLYVFDADVPTSTFIRYRCMVGMVTSVLLFIPLCLPNLPYTLQWQIPCIIYSIYLIVMTIKTTRMFGLSLGTILVMIIYIIHVELVTMAGLLYGTDYLIRVLHA